MRRSTKPVALAALFGMVLALGFALDSANARGGLSRGDQKVRINLKNGAVFEGVVRHKELYERLENGWFHPVDEDQARRNDGIRIWYPGFAQGFVFVRKKDIRSVEKLDRIQAGEAEEIQRIVADKANQAIDAYNAVLRAREDQRDREQLPQDLVERASGFPEDGEAFEAVPPERVVGEYALLDRFPPEEGWGEERADRLERRKWLIGVFPNSDEKAFLSVFPRWREQYTEWINSSGTGFQEGEGGLEPVDDGTMVSSPSPDLGIEERGRPDSQVGEGTPGTRERLAGKPRSGDPNGQRPGGKGGRARLGNPKKQSGGPGSQVLGDRLTDRDPASPVKAPSTLGLGAETTSETKGRLGATSGSAPQEKSAIVPTTPKKKAKRIFENPKKSASTGSDSGSNSNAGDPAEGDPDSKSGDSK